MLCDPAQREMAHQFWQEGPAAPQNDCQCRHLEGHLKGRQEPHHHTYFKDVFVHQDQEAIKKSIPFTLFQVPSFTQGICEIANIAQVQCRR